MIHIFKYKLEKYNEELEVIKVIEKSEVMEFVVTGKTFLNFKNKTGQEFMEMISNINGEEVPLTELLTFLAVCYKSKGQQNEDTFNYIMEHEKGIELVLDQTFMEKFVKSLVNENFSQPANGSKSGK